MKLKDKKITIYKKVSGKDADGFPAEVWEAIGPLWAYYRQLSGNEIYASSAVYNEEDSVFSINWRNDITPSMVIGFRGKYYNITRVDDYEGYKRDLQLYAKYNGSLTPPTA